MSSHVLIPQKELYDTLSSAFMGYLTSKNYGNRHQLTHLFWETMKEVEEKENRGIRTELKDLTISRDVRQLIQVEEQKIIADELESVFDTFFLFDVSGNFSPERWFEQLLLKCFQERIFPHEKKEELKALLRKAVDHEVMSKRFVSKDVTSDASELMKVYSSEVVSTLRNHVQQAISKTGMQELKKDPTISKEDLMKIPVEEMERFILYNLSIAYYDLHLITDSILPAIYKKNEEVFEKSSPRASMPEDISDYLATAAASPLKRSSSKRKPKHLRRASLVNTAARTSDHTPSSNGETAPLKQTSSSRRSSQSLTQSPLGTPSRASDHTLNAEGETTKNNKLSRRSSMMRFASFDNLRKSAGSGNLAIATYPVRLLHFYRALRSLRDLLEVKIDNRKAFEKLDEGKPTHDKEGKPTHDQTLFKGTEDLKNQLSSALEALRKLEEFPDYELTATEKK